MRIKGWRRAAGVVLAAALFFAPCGQQAGPPRVLAASWAAGERDTAGEPAAESGGGLREGFRLKDTEHGQVNFADMKYTRTDPAVMKSLAGNIRRLSRSEDRRELTVLLFERLIRRYDRAEGMYRLAGVMADLDGKDEYFQAEETAMEMLETELSEMLRDAAQTILDSPCGAYAAEQWGEAFCAAVGDEEAMTPEQEKLSCRETELLSEHADKSIDEYYADWNGKKVGMADIDQLYEEGEISDSQWNDLCAEISRAQNEVLGPIYVELLKVRTQMAELTNNGQGQKQNYLDQMYGSYMREYSTEDTSALFQSVKKIIVPLEDKIISAKNTDGLNEYAARYLDPAETMKRVSAHLGEIGPELTEAYDYMVKYGLYDLEYRENKFNGAYTIALPAEHSVFMMNQPDGSFYDFTSFIHEFGHYNQTYWTEIYPTWPESFNVDVFEVHSQGLELLFLEYYDDMLGEYADRGKTDLLENLIYSITGACMTDQFEQYAYSHPKATLQELNEAAARIGAEYGYEMDWQPYDWVETSHIYESPGYYISYAVSAIAAFELWAGSIHDRGQALEDYYDLINMPDEPLFAALEKCGLSHPFGEGVLERIRRTVERELDIPWDVYGHWSEYYVDDLSYRGIDLREAGMLDQRPDSEEQGISFQPERPVTRREYAALLYGLADQEGGGPTAKIDFSDIEDGALSRQDMALMTWRFAQTCGAELPGGGRRMKGFSDEAVIGEGRLEAVRDLWKGGALNGYPDGSFRPLEQATRGEAAALIAQLSIQSFI